MKGSSIRLREESFLQKCISKCIEIDAIVFVELFIHVRPFFVLLMKKRIFQYTIWKRCRWREQRFIDVNPFEEARRN